MYRNMKRIAQLEREQGRQRILETELERYDDYLISAKQNRHDLRHHNTLLSEFLAEGDIDGARTYLAQCDEILKKSTPDPSL